MTNVLDVGSEYVNVDGHIVEKDALLIVEAIKEYDPNLEVICIDPHKADINDAPFIIAQHCPDGVLRRIFECWKLDQSVLARIEAADTTRHDVQAKMDWINSEAKKEAKKRYKEKTAEFVDIGSVLLKHRKSSFTYKDPKTGDMVTIHEDRPSERK